MSRKAANGGVIASEVRHKERLLGPSKLLKILPERQNYSKTPLVQCLLRPNQGKRQTKK